MEMLHNAVSWFEIPVIDFERAKRFYSAIYDYEMPEMLMGEAQMGFLPHDMENGGIGGAIVHATDFVPSKEGTRVYLNGGDDLTVVLNRIEAAGGKVIMGKTEITPEYGYFAVFEDTEGNHVALHSTK